MPAGSRCDLCGQDADGHRAASDHALTRFPEWVPGTPLPCSCGKHAVDHLAPFRCCPATAVRVTVDPWEPIADSDEMRMAHRESIDVLLSTIANHRDVDFYVWTEKRVVGPFFERRHNDADGCDCGVAYTMQGLRRGIPGTCRNRFPANLHLRYAETSPRKDHERFL